MSTAPERDDILDGLVADWLDAAAAIAKHQTRKEELAHQILQRLPAGGRHEIADGVGVRAQSAPARFDPKKAAQVLSADQLNAISEAKPSPSLARKLLPGVLYEQLTTLAGEPTLRSL